MTENDEEDDEQASGPDLIEDDSTAQHPDADEDTIDVPQPDEAGVASGIEGAADSDESDSEPNPENDFTDVEESEEEDLPVRGKPLSSDESDMDTEDSRGMNITSVPSQMDARPL